MRAASISNVAAYVVIGLCGVVLPSQLSCRKVPSGEKPTPASKALATPLPPDLNKCKRVEIRFAPSTLEFIGVLPRGKSLLNAEETKYLESAAPFIVDNPEAIKALAEDIASSTYDGPIPGISGIQYQIHWTCYNENERAIGFTTIGNVVEVGNELEADGQRFKNNGIRLSVLLPQVVPFQLRVACAWNLAELRSGLLYYLEERKSYPPATEWYDATVDRYRAKGYTVNVARLTKAMKCPGAHEDQCHYAMNSGCEPNSPPDMVLLFESKAGRNQHGGPELSTFDNHNPRGGLACLNNGTVRFIRTEEELKQLRWK